MYDLSQRIDSRGFSLLEMLVAMSILAFGLLGLAAMQITAIRANSKSMRRTEAITRAETAIDQYRNTPFPQIAAPSPATQTDAAGFTTTTTVTPDVLNTTKTIIIQVAWRDIALHRVTLRTVVANPDA